MHNGDIHSMNSAVIIKGRKGKKSQDLIDDAADDAKIVMDKDGA